MSCPAGQPLKDHSTLWRDVSLNEWVGQTDWIAGVRCIRGKLPSNLLGARLHVRFPSIHPSNCARTGHRTQAVGIFQLTMALGAGTAAVIGVVVLPSLAADEMRERVAEAMEGTGAAVARYVDASKV